MKKVTRKARERNVRVALAHRRGIRHFRGHEPSSGPAELQSARQSQRWILEQIHAGNLNAEFNDRGEVLLRLPEVMNFSTDYEATALYIRAIRDLAPSRNIFVKGLKLRIVIFDDLREISTSAALVLTSEMCRWDDHLRQRLRPFPSNWHPDIFSRFYQLGYFDLFKKSDEVERLASADSPDIRIVKYIKGQCGDAAKTRQLKHEITEIIGDKIKKWTFLSSGLSEAITNVTHHAYPETSGYHEDDKNWYLSGAYNPKTKELKVVFFDQGIGIPRSLPASSIWEVVADWLKIIPAVDRMKDEMLLKAAVEIDRTSTGDSDRGKGLPDMLEFIKQRGEGYISILSQHGLYKHTQNGNAVRTKSERFLNPLNGTLIIWKVSLDL